jgi:hypothetical protein
VIEVGEDLEALGNDRVRTLAPDMGDEAHAAAVALVARVVETLKIRFPLLHRSRLSQQNESRKRF